QESGRAARLGFQWGAGRCRQQWGRSGEFPVSPRQAIWITGVGTANPLGNTFHRFAECLLHGQSCVRSVAAFDVSQHPSQIAVRIASIPCPPDMAPEGFTALQPLEQLVTWCANSALRDAGWWEARGDVRLGLVLGIGAEWALLWETDGLPGGNRIRHPEL